MTREELQAMLADQEYQKQRVAEMNNIRQAQTVDPQTGMSPAVADAQMQGRTGPQNEQPSPEVAQLIAIAESGGPHAAEAQARLQQMAPQAPVQRPSLSQVDPRELQAFLESKQQANPAITDWARQQVTGQ